MNLSNLVGQVLKEMISARGLTYTVYAEKAGVTQGYISQVVNGDIKGVKLETLEKLVKPLEITVSDFLREVEKKGVYSLTLTDDERCGSAAREGRGRVA